MTRPASRGSSTPVSEGFHTLEVQAKDAVGNIDLSPASRTWTVDDTAPGAPVITMVRGTAEPGSMVRLYEDGTRVGTDEADGRVEHRPHRDPRRLPRLQGEGHGRGGQRARAGQDLELHHCEAVSQGVEQLYRGGAFAGSAPPL